MRNNSVLFLVISMLISGCATTLEQPTGEKTADAIIGHWKDALNEYDDHYFSQDGKSTMISPIGDYFVGTYEIVGQDIDDRSLELKIIDNVPGEDNIFRRRLLGKFSEDYKTFSGKSLVASKIPFSFEYFDDQQFVIDAEARQLMKYLKEFKKDLAETRNSRARIRESVTNIKSDYDLRNRELEAQIEKLQLQIDELRKQMKNSIDASSKQEEDKPTPEGVE